MGTPRGKNRNTKGNIWVQIKKDPGEEQFISIAREVLNIEEGVLW